jgi:hypothetical protein
MLNVMKNSAHGLLVNFYLIFVCDWFRCCLAVADVSGLVAFLERSTNTTNEILLLHETKTKPVTNKN